MGIRPSHNDTPPPFILVFSPVPQICVSFSLFGVVTRLINPHVGVVGEELDGMVRVWVCQAMGSTLRCWQPFPLCCSCAESVLFFGCFAICQAQSRPRPHPWAFKGLLLCLPVNRAPRPGLWALNVKWAGIPIFRPHNSPSKSCFPTF